MTTTSRRHELWVVTILSLAWGVVNFEMLAITYVTPFIASSLKLNNTEVGVLVSTYWVPFGLSSYVAGHLTDKYGKWKLSLVIALLVFAATSILSGFTRSFFALLAARLLMGVIEGPILPITQTITMLESAVERRGLNIGIVLNVGSAILAGFVAPLLVVELAVRYGWQTDFFVAWLPGLICAALVAYFIRELPAPQSFSTATQATEAQGPDGAGTNGGSGLLGILRFRNIWLVSVGACLFVAHIIIGLGYLPLFFIKNRQFLPQQMSLLMSLLGISNVVLGVVLPAMADRFGRKFVSILSSVLGLLCPLAALYCPGPLAVLGLLMFIGWAPSSTLPLFFATIPSESVPARFMSTAIGFIAGVSTLLGGTAIPLFAGWAADQWGLNGALWLQAACSGLTAILCLALHETLPCKSKAPAPLANDLGV
jgi:MFS family permease